MGRNDFYRYIFTRYLEFFKMLTHPTVPWVFDISLKTFYPLIFHIWNIFVISVIQTIVLEPWEKVTRLLGHNQIALKTFALWIKNILLQIRFFSSKSSKIISIKKLNAKFKYLVVFFFSVYNDFRTEENSSQKSLAKKMKFIHRILNDDWNISPHYF